MSRTARPPRPRLGVGAMTLGPAPHRFTLAIVESDDDDVLRQTGGWSRMGFGGFGSESFFFPW